MARPRKQTVDYFPHVCIHKKTLYIVEQRFGNDGYAFWFKLLEMLGSTEGHYLDLKCVEAWEFLQAKTMMDSESCINVLGLLANLGAIDKALWLEEKVIWSQNFVDGIADVYKKRYAETPLKPSFRTENRVSDTENTQSKVKESKGKNKDILSGTEHPTARSYETIIEHLNKETSKRFRSSSKTTRKLINARWQEGYREADFIEVIDSQVITWLDDTEKHIYLRPQTLFGENFESYLNNKPKGGKRRVFGKSKSDSKYDHLVVNMMED